MSQPHGAVSRRSRVLMPLVGLAALSLGFTITPARATTASAATIAPGPTSMMDCNGWSPQYPSPVPAMKMRCADPVAVNSVPAPYGSGAVDTTPENSRFYDNGHYVGHDEPSTKFISTVPGSGNTFTLFQQLPVDPSPSLNRTVTPTGTTVADYAVLSPAPWIGLPICDPNSYPNGACTPDSDTNAPASTGSAFMELQFYPPKYGPWPDNVSMDLTKWTAALNIDSLECPGNSTTGCTQPNTRCVEPLNFALLTHDGVPTGPPGPQAANGSTFAENNDTLQMNPGDTLEVRITDVPDAGSPSTGGLRAEVDDITTGQSGFIITSAANGFTNTDNVTCNGSPYSFHAEYSTASRGNQVPWAALEGGLLIEQEIGHSEPCASISGPDPQSTAANGFSDPAVQDTCTGPFEAQNGGSSTGEGPCGTGQPASGNCPGASTEGTTATTCPFNAATLGGNCEQSDGFCLPSGPRTVTLNGVPTTWNQPVTACQQNKDQNGDLDFDGSPYIADWPDGTSTHPTSMRYLGPFDPAGNPYPTTQFETDGPGSENNCNPSAPTATTCKVPPDGASFYPFWSLTNRQGLSGLAVNTPVPACAWNFGNDVAGVTTQDFGRAVQYGSASSQYGGTLISAPASNPAVSGSCPSVTLSQVTGSHYVPLAPSRVLDTRLPAAGTCLQGATSVPCATLGPAQKLDVQVTGAHDVTTGALSGVPSDGSVTAVVLNVTATDTTASSFLTVWPAGTTQPVASNLNFVAGQVVPNLVEVPVSPAGRVSVYNLAGSADVVFDVAGYYSSSNAVSAGLLRPLAPVRIMDTRGSSPGCNGGGACNTLGPGQSLTLQVAGGIDIGTGNPNGVPADGSAGAVAVNVTVTNPTASGFLTIAPTGQPRPVVSNLNFVPGQTVPNRVLVKLGNDGGITIFNNAGTTDVVVDVGGYVTSATATGLTGGYRAVSPARILDSRDGLGVCSPSCATLQPNTSLTLQVAGSRDIHTGAASGVPATSSGAPPSAVVLNVTAVGPTSASLLTVYPGGSLPVISDLNMTRGVTVPNLVVVRLNPDGTVTIYNQQGAVDVVVDVEGWYS